MERFLRQCLSVCVYMRTRTHTYINTYTRVFPKIPSLTKKTNSDFSSLIRLEKMLSKSLLSKDYNFLHDSPIYERERERDGN